MNMAPTLRRLAGRCPPRGLISLGAAQREILAPTLRHFAGRCAGQRAPFSGAAKQLGAAILAAMLMVTLVASIAAAAAWQQWRAVEVESAQRGRVQATWMLVGALDWARLILREDAKAGGADHLGEPWAVPLEEAKLATFISADGTTSDRAEDITQSYVSGRITDLQGRLNVRNLVDNGSVSAVALRQFGRLYELLGLPDEELQRLAENLRFALDASPDNGNSVRAPLMPQRYVQLGWLGLSPRSQSLLAPYATLLPERTPLNVNTAPTEVIFASLEEPDMALARRLVTARAQAPFKTLGEASRMLNDVPGQLAPEHHSVTSRYFEVQGRLRLDDLLLQERTLVVRNGIEARALWRERLAVP